MPAEQLTFFPSLDFPGRTTLLISEIAERIGVSEKHLFNLIDSGDLVVPDYKKSVSSRRCIRVPIEVYRDFVLSRLTGPLPAQAELLRNLPPAVKRQLISELQASLR